MQNEYTRTRRSSSDSHANDITKIKKIYIQIFVFREYICSSRKHMKLIKCNKFTFENAKILVKCQRKSFSLKTHKTNGFTSRTHNFHLPPFVHYWTQISIPSRNICSFKNYSQYISNMQILLNAPVMRVSKLVIFSKAIFSL